MTLQKLVPQPFLTALVGLAPARTRHISPERALQRLNYTSGRTITESAIETEQGWAEARLGVVGRYLSAGVVEGLRVGVPEQSISAGAFSLSAGYGISPGGQDVAVLKSAELSLAEIPELGTSGEVPGGASGIVALVLEPVCVETEKLRQDGLERIAFEDPCPPDATTAPYLDFVSQDAVRLGWIGFPNDIGGMDAAREANVAAEAIRAQEAADPESLPWSDRGLAVCLMRVDAQGRIVWHHHAAVARKGGLLPRGGAGRGDILRQSRLEGLIEEIAGASRSGWDGTGTAKFLRTIPPAGILSRKSWDSPGFFPEGWAVAHAPIPYSQLDAALEAARRMAPFDLDAAHDRAKFLVPVPDEFYAADLLEPIADPDWAAVRTPLRQAVGDRLALRNAYRAQARSVQGAIDFSAVTDFLQAEDDPIPGENGFPARDPEPEAYDDDAVAALNRIHEGLSAVLFTEAQRAIVDPARLNGALAPQTRFGLTPFVTEMRGLLDQANDTIDLSFNRVQAEIYRLRQIMLDEEEATKLATFPVLAGLAKGSNAYALSEGIKAHFLAKKTDATNSPTRAAPTGDTVPIMLNAARSDGAATGLSRLAIGREAAIAPIASRPAVLKGTTLLSGFASNNATRVFGVNLAEATLVEASDTSLVKDLVDNTRAGLVDDAILADADAKRSGILRAAPLPGDIRDVRNATIADRLKASGALDAKASAVRIKADVMRALQAIGLSLEGLKAPLTSSRDRVLLPRQTIDTVIAKTLSRDEQVVLSRQIAQLRTPLGDTGDQMWDLMQLPTAQALSVAGNVELQPLTRLSSALLRETAPFTLAILPGLTLAKQLDPDPSDKTGSDAEVDDEAAYLDSAVTVLEGVIALIRQAEGRVLAISDAVEAAAAELPGMNQAQGAWQQALNAADQDLDEARHDLRVAESLIAEETARLEKLAVTRQRILDEEVKFVAYTRPRALMAHRKGDTPGQLLPGAFVDPLPAVLKRDVTLPKELAVLVGILREMPIAWFSADPELLGSFKDPEYMGRVLQRAPYRARSKKATRKSYVAQQGQSPAMMQVAAITTAYQAMSAQLFDMRAAVDVQALSEASWQEQQREALALLSLNDLIESGEQPKVAKLAAAEIEDIERVLHALWQQARQVSPTIRLLWAQELSAYDTVTSLALLPKLPGWALVPFDLRQRLERLNSWLFSRLDAGLNEARGFMTDLVRVALLIAAHAPVAEIVLARVDEAQTATKGAPLDVTISKGDPKIGMKVSFLDAGIVMAWGQIADLSGTRARVQIVDTVQPLVQIGVTQTVSIYDPGAIAKGAL